MAGECNEEEFLLLVTYIQQQEQELAIEKLRLGDAELEIRDLKGELSSKTESLETLQKEADYRERQIRRECSKDNRHEIQNMTLYCKQLEDIVDVMEERIGELNAAHELVLLKATDYQSHLEQIALYVYELEEQLSRRNELKAYHRHHDQQQKQEEDIISPLYVERISPSVFDMVSPPRHQKLHHSPPPRRIPRKSVGMQAGSGLIEEAEDQARLAERVAELMVKYTESRREEQAAQEQVARLVEELNRSTASNEETMKQLNEARDLLRNMVHGWHGAHAASTTSTAGVSDKITKDGRHVDQDEEEREEDLMSISSNDSRRFASKRWLTNKVLELRKRIPPLALGGSGSGGLHSARVAPSTCSRDNGFDDEDGETASLSFEGESNSTARKSSQEDPLHSNSGRDSLSLASSHSARSWISTTSTPARYQKKKPSPNTVVPTYIDI